jgi:ArsR family transcriptional regulator
MKAPVAFAKAIADETRFRVIRLLYDRTLCVCELAEILKLPQSTLSSHLRVIDKAGLLDCERRGKWLFYRVSDGERPILATLFAHFGASPENDRILGCDDRSAAKCIAEREAACCPVIKNSDK